MLLQLTTTRRPATDLGYLLHKNPARAQAFDLSFGRVHVFYPEATPERCTAALLLDVDSVGLVRGAAEQAVHPHLDRARRHEEPNQGRSRAELRRVNSRRAA